MILRLCSSIIVVVVVVVITEAFSMSFGGQDFWELQSKNIWGPELGNHSSKRCIAPEDSSLHTPSQLDSKQTILGPSLASYSWHTLMHALQKSDMYVQIHEPLCQRNGAFTLLAMQTTLWGISWCLPFFFTCPFLG